jgi:hypothetical protein
MGSLLAQSSPKSLRVLGSHGRAAWHSHAPIQSLIRQSIRDRGRAERVAAFFASPVLEPDGEVMSWYAAARGFARPWSMLGEDERRRAEGEVSEICRELSELAVAIRSRSSGGGALAEVIEQALRRPETCDSLFLVGDQPVSVWWGFQDQPASADTAPPAALPPLPQWPPAKVESEPTQSPAPEPVPPAAVSERPAVWRWMKWLLLALLLILLLMAVFALRGCERWPWDRDGAAEEPGPPIAQPVAPEQAAASGATAVAPDAPAPQQPRSGDHIEIPKAAQESSRVEFIAGRYVLGSEGALSDGTRGRFLINSLGQEPRDPQPIRLELEFANDGIGKEVTTFVQAGGRCEGRASATMNDGQLTIKLHGAICSGVPRRAELSPLEVNCSVQSGRTVCSWVNPSGSKVSNVPLVHQ